jgi:hypothetical protein
MVLPSGDSMPDGGGSMVIAGSVTEVEAGATAAALAKGSSLIDLPVAD